jgi:hypothetical protein
LDKKTRIDDNHIVNLLQYYELVNELKTLWKSINSPSSSENLS